MKKKISLFVASFALAAGITFGLSFETTAISAQSCKGQCQASFNGCVNRAKTQAERAKCNKSFQGCISSCK